MLVLRVLRKVPGWIRWVMLYPFRKLTWRWYFHHYYYYDWRSYSYPDDVDPRIARWDGETTPRMKDLGSFGNSRILLRRNYSVDPVTNKRHWIEMPQELFDRYADVHRHPKFGIDSPVKMRQAVLLTHKVGPPDLGDASPGWFWKRFVVPYRRFVWEWHLGRYYHLALAPHMGVLIPTWLRRRRSVRDPHTGRRVWVEMPQEIFDRYVDVHGYGSQGAGMYTPWEMRYITTPWDKTKPRHGSKEWEKLVEPWASRESEQLDCSGRS